MCVEVDEVAGEEEVVFGLHSHGISHECSRVHCQSGSEFAGYTANMLVSVQSHGTKSADVECSKNMRAQRMRFRYIFPHFEIFFCLIDFHIHFGIFLRVQNSCDRNTEVRGRAPEICRLSHKSAFRFHKESSVAIAQRWVLGASRRQQPADQRPKIRFPPPTKERIDRMHTYE